MFLKINKKLMVGKTHRIAGIAFPLFYGITTGNLQEMGAIVFIMAPFLGQLSDFDMNSKNTTISEVIDSFKRQGPIEQSLRIFFKKISGGQHRGFTHSLVMTLILFLLFTIVILFGGTIHTVIGLTLAFVSHIIIDMFNGAGVRLFWPHPWKINFLNIVPNILKLGKGEQYRAKGFKLHWVFKLIGMSLSVVAMYFTLKFAFSQEELAITIIGLGATLIEFYLFLKFMFVLTGSQEEDVIVYWPFMIATVLMAITHYEDIYNIAINGGLWLSNHAVILLLSFAFLIFKGYYIFGTKLKYLFKTSKIGLTMLLLISIIALTHPENIQKSFTNFDINEVKEIGVDNVIESYKESIIKAQKDFSSEVIKK